MAERENSILSACIGSGQIGNLPARNIARTLPGLKPKARATSGTVRVRRDASIDLPLQSDVSDNNISMRLCYGNVKHKTKVSELRPR
jgi:hypothetical protein